MTAPTITITLTHPVTGEKTELPVSFVHSETGAPLATAITPQSIAAILATIIAAEPKVAAYLRGLAPYCANLPSPWNLPANPVVEEALDTFPTLLPVLQELENILLQLSPPVVGGTDSLDGPQTEAPPA